MFGNFDHNISIKDTNGFNLSIDGLYLRIRGMIGKEETVFGWDGWMIWYDADDGLF